MGFLRRWCYWPTEIFGTDRPTSREGSTMVQLEAMDHVILFIVVVVSLAIDWIVYPRLLRATPDQADRRREQFYITTIVAAWAITAAIIALWLRTDRPLTTLGLGIGSPIRLVISLAVVLGLVALLRKQNRMLLARPERLRAVRGKFGRTAAIIPRTQGQRRIFVGVSLTAWICEELIFRGFVVWYLAYWAGPVAAFVRSEDD